MSDEPLPQSEIILYQTEDGRTRVQCRFENETVWLSQQHMAELFQTTKQNVGLHLKSILEEGELIQDSVVMDFFTTAADGKGYATQHYNPALSASAAQPVPGSTLAARELPGGR